MLWVAVKSTEYHSFVYSLYEQFYHSKILLVCESVNVSDQTTNILKQIIFFIEELVSYYVFTLKFNWFTIEVFLSIYVSLKTITEQSIRNNLKKLFKTGNCSSVFER